MEYYLLQEQIFKKSNGIKIYLILIEFVVIFIYKKSKIL
jgi:hypothetical protein